MTCSFPRGDVRTYAHIIMFFIQATLVGPRGLLVFVVALVGGRALLWPTGNARVPHSAVLERKPTQQTAPVLLVARVTVGLEADPHIISQAYSVYQ